MLEIHPLSSFFPALVGAEFEDLKADIAANGQHEPIVMHEGMVLDGGNRARACAELGIEPLTVEYDGNDPVAYVLSKNLHRRHLTPAQRAAIVATAADWSTAHTHGGARRGEAQGAQVPVESGPALRSIAQRAAVAGVAERTQKKADKVAKADPALAREVAAGHMSLDAAVSKVDRKKEPKDKTAAKPASKPAVEPNPDLPGEDDILKDLAELQERNRVLEAELATVNSDSPAAEALRWQRMYEHAKAEQAAAMERAAKAVETRDWYARQLKRCGKAVGQDDPDRIAAAVESMARDLKAKKGIGA